MEQINALDLTADHISIDRCRELLGDEAAGLSDEQVDKIWRHAETMARAIIEVFLQTRTTVH